jgi:PKHD-type hydroxylase
MLVHIPQVLSPEQLRHVRTELAHASWRDGRSTAGAQAVQVKNNEQLAQDSPQWAALQALVVQAVRAQPLFLSAALPKKIFNPLFNRYGGTANHYGAHIDNAILHARLPEQIVRSDVSCTLFLAEPHEYDGGELTIHDTYGSQRVKLPAGDLVLYPSTSLHEVRPVTRGQRLASFFWVESMVRSDEQRRLLYELDMTLLRLRQRHGETPETTALSGTYHNLLRMWADT